MDALTVGKCLTNWLAVLIIASASLVAGSTSGRAAPITPSSVDPIQHIIDCWHAMINNPAAHAAGCPPGPMPPTQLAPTFSSPTTGCIRLSGELLVPLGTTLVATLDDPHELMRVADNCYEPCYPYDSSIKGFETFDVASLGSIREDMQLGAGSHERRIAVYCD